MGAVGWLRDDFLRAPKTAIPAANLTQNLNNEIIE